MKSETALVAAQVRYQQWINDIRECNTQPAGVTVADWCAEHQIKKETYYYRMKVLRRACLDFSSVQDVAETEGQAPADSRFVELQPCCDQPSETVPVSVTIQIGNASIEVADTISDDFLRRIVGGGITCLITQKGLTGFT